MKFIEPKGIGVFLDEEEKDTIKKAVAIIDKIKDKLRECGADTSHLHCSDNPPNGPYYDFFEIDDVTITLYEIAENPMFIRED